MHWQFAALNCHTVSALENVADNLSFIKAGVGHINIDLAVHLISQRNQELTSRVGIEGIISPFFLENVVDSVLSSPRSI